MSISNHSDYPSTGVSKLIKASDKRAQGLQWQPDLNRDFDDLFTGTDWRSVVTQSRLIFSNFPVPRSASVQKAQHTVGSAWKPEFNGESTEWGEEELIPYLELWLKNMDLRGDIFDGNMNLHLDSIAIDRDGDVFSLLTIDDLGFPKIQKIEAHRVGNRSGIKIVESGIFKGRKILNGVVKNEFNRTIAFYVLGDTKAEDIVVDAGSMVHHYDPEYHSQGRGVPAFAAVIPELRKAKTSEEWELMAQLVHSAHSIIEYNDSGAADFTGADQPEPDSDGLDVQTFAGGMVRYMKANSGNKIESITSARPSDMWDRFQDRIQRSACVSVAWPFELTWKPEGLNGVSVRSVQDKARHSVARRQVVLAKGRRKEVEFAIAVGIKNGYLAAPPIASDWDKFSFSLPPQMTIDPRHDSKTEEDQYKLGRVNMTALLKRDGKSYLPHLKERLNEICLRKKWIAIYEEKFDCQIDDREVFMLTPNEMAEAVEVESEEIETQTENQDDK